MHTRRLTAPRRLRRAVLAATTGVALVAASAGMAVADTVYNTVDSSVDNASETLSVTAGSTATTTIKLTKQEAKNDGTLQPGNSTANNECLVSTSNPLLLNLVSSDPSKATVQATSPYDASKPAQLRFTTCDEAVGQSITVTGVAAGSATISVTKSAGANNPGDFHLAPATFTANVTAAQQTNPCAGATAPASPTVTFSPAGPDGRNDWYKTVPTVSASSTTSGVTIEYSTDGGANYSTTAPTLGQGETAVTAKATNSCNLSSTGTATAKVDTIAPSIPVQSLTDNTWRNSDLSRTFAASDTGSGLADAADASFTLTASAESTRNAAGEVVPTTDSRTVTDNAGHSATRTVSALIDRTAPKVEPGDYIHEGWSRDAVTRSFTASDDLSGLAGGMPTAFDLTASIETTSSDNLTSEAKTIRDAAGNEVTRTLSAKIDSSDPIVSGDDVTETAWRKTDLSLPFTASDTRSGLANSADEEFTLTTSGESPDSTTPVTDFRTVSDAVGNSTTRTISAMVDKTDPEISGADVNDTTWRNTPLSENFTARDVLSGLAQEGDANFTLTASDDSTLDANGNPVPTTAQKDVGDKAGNGVTRKLSALIDTVRPVNAVTGPADGASYKRTEVPTAGCTTTDALSGAASQATVSTSRTGLSVTVTCSGGADNAGNQAQAVSVSYTIEYDFGGFQSPINPTALNRVKAGSAVPVKFSLGGDQGMSIFSGTPKAAAMTCTGTVDPINAEETATAGQSGLQYDPRSNVYTYVWKTDTRWAGSCRQLQVQFADGTTRKANFNFMK